jgi:hypothetical protein
MKTRARYGLLITVTLCACASPPRTNTSPPVSESGIAFVSLGAAPLFSTVPASLQIRDVASNATASFDLEIRQRPFTPWVDDFSSHEGAGSVVALRLPAARYAIENFTHAIQQYRTVTYTSSKIPLAIEFDVEKGRATYLGEYLSYPAAKPTVLAAMQRPVSFAYLVVQDRLVRDAPLLAKLMPEAGSYTIANAVPKKSPSPLLRMTPPYVISAAELAQIRRDQARAQKELTDAILNPKRCPQPVC